MEQTKGMTRYVPVKLAFNCVEPENCTKEKPPIIFLHGVTESKNTWRDIPQTVALETRQKVYVLDARNHGDSDWSDTFHFDCNVDDLLNFMDSNNISKATIVGHSMGGYTGIRTALQSPERVVKLVVEDRSPIKNSRQTPSFVLLILSLIKMAQSQVPQNATIEEASKFISDTVSNGIPPDMKNKFVSKQYADEIFFDLKQSEDGYCSVKFNIDVLMNSLKSPDRFLTDHTGVFQGPAYFIYGTLSPFAVGESELETRKLFPNAEFAAIENATHTVHTDCPVEFTEALIKYLLKE